MLDVIAGAFNALKGATDITQGLLALKTSTAVAAKANELNGIIATVQQQLFAAQADYAAIAGRIAELEAEITDLKNWEEEKQRYQLHELAPGSFVRRVKPEMQNGEPLHDLCTNCYQQGIKSILQYHGVVRHHVAFHCLRCGGEVLGAHVQAPPRPAPAYSRYLSR
ncbi:hypothetical protein [Chitiniphilus shinanonensis]|uniref:hypothetical protein n=1 Tax=Chitiniphilus shinanonensis TaxID=553088 RepID=UPI0030643A3A